MVLAQSTGVVLAEEGPPRLDRDAPVVADRAAALKVSLLSAQASPRDVRLVVETLDPSTGGRLPAETPDLMGHCADVAVSPSTTTQLARGLSGWEAR